MTMEESTFLKGRIGESFVYNKLIESGIKATWVSFTNRRGAVDFITDNGTTIDVKFSKEHATGKRWCFNCHHHNVKQTNIDFYVCVLLNNAGNSIAFVFPANLIAGKTMTMSLEQIERGTYDYFINNYTLIKNQKSPDKALLKQRAKMLRMRDELLGASSSETTAIYSDVYTQARIKRQRHLNLSKIHKGRIVSPETRAKQSESKKVYWANAPTERHKHSGDTKLKMSQARLAYYERLRATQAEALDKSVGELFGD